MTLMSKGPPLPPEAATAVEDAMGYGKRKGLANLNVTREWFEKKAALEGDLEIGAGTAEPSAAVDAIIERLEGAWAQCCGCIDLRVLTDASDALQMLRAQVQLLSNPSPAAAPSGLVRSLSWAVGELSDWDAYQRRPERGDWGSECACCMGEMFDAEDLARLDEARAALAAAGDPTGHCTGGPTGLSCVPGVNNDL